MTKGKFDVQGFYAALDAVRQTQNLSWKKVATKAGVSASTLTRMAQGKRPDVDTMAALTAWSGLKADQFVHREHGAPTKADTLGEVTALLRADRNLTTRDADMLSTVLKATYEQMRKR